MHTPLYQQHLDLDGQMVDFAGWSLPARYTDVMAEHHAVRRASGVFDVSHMTIVDIKGSDAKNFLRYLLANDIEKLKISGKALYSCMLNNDGGILDDLITYYFADDDYRIVVNAATREKDLAWIRQQASAYQVSISEQPELALLALQGPEAEQQLSQALPEYKAFITELKPFNAFRNDQLTIARTGYTGEDGFEIMLNETAAVELVENINRIRCYAVRIGRT